MSAPDTRRVPFVGLDRQYRSVRDELLQAMDEVGNSGGYVLGDRVAAFEMAIATYCGSRFAIGVNSGADALFLSLKHYGIGEGDEVITAPNSFIATAWVIAAAGARPVFADVADDYNIDPDAVARAVTPRTRAIIPVHLTGRPADMDPLMAIARRHGLRVIEDAAQAIGARYHGRRVGSFGDTGCFSLHPLKNLGVYGDGGVITTDDEAAYHSLLKWRNHGLRNRDECEFWGYNSRLDAIQAAFATVKLARLDAWNQRCREIATLYREALRGLVWVPEDAPDTEGVYHNFVIRTPNRDQLMAHMQAQGVDSRIHYPIPLHLQEAAAYLGYHAGDFPVTERQAKEIVSLPIYPELEASEIEQVIDAVRSFF